MQISAKTPRGPRSPTSSLPLSTSSSNSLRSCCWTHSTCSADVVKQYDCMKWPYSRAISGRVTADDEHAIHTNLCHSTKTYRPKHCHHRTWFSLPYSFSVVLMDDVVLNADIVGNSRRLDWLRTFCGDAQQPTSQMHTKLSHTSSQQL